ncbi:N-acetylneuraminate synthase family protein [bacterium]|nr:N-acetylneuraminate synthase family protein [bacterium]
MTNPINFHTISSYIIAEVGQNHQGSLEEALRYVSVYAGLGADAVKFQMRDNKYLFDSSIYNSVYNSENSFGNTYGSHRENLELTLDDFLRLKERCQMYNIGFIVTPFDEPSLERCISIGVDILKVASFDIGNIPFLKLIGQTKLPVVMSTGGSQLKQIQESVKCITDYHNNIALLHCVSKYPCPANEMQLNKLKTLISSFPDVVVGLSDHFNGIITGPLGFMLGAKVFEKHVTFDRALKGTDHPFSLEPDGFRRFVRDIKRTPILLQINEELEVGNEPVFQKLGKSICAACNIPAETIITPQMLSGKIVRPTVIPVRESMNVIGKATKINIPKGAFLDHCHLQS